ncbi:beta strand repeat-containing protein, partial [Zobellia laminariae]|uniref:beta strand repeat-containing protein n=1 Tax=Zobellia laminariae TaxID=248906 RepID=UPI003EF2597E
QDDVDQNEADADAAIALKEDAVNKSTDVTLADVTDTKFPTELAVKTYVDGQITATADDDITGVTINTSSILTISEGGTSVTANLSALEESADITAVQNDVNQNEADADADILAEQLRATAAETTLQNNINLKEDANNKSTDVNLADASNTKFPTELAVKTYVDSQVGSVNSLANGNIFVGDNSNIAQGVAMSGDATLSNTGALTIETDAVTAAKINSDVAGNGLSQNATTGALEVDALNISDLVTGNKIATITQPDASTVAINETITSFAEVSGNRSILRFTNEANGTDDVTSVVRSVNGVVPAANGNVAVILSSTSTGLEVNLPSTGVDSDIYIVSGESGLTADRNGVAFIYDDVTGWQEVTTDLSTNDARYLNVNGDAMAGTLSMASHPLTNLLDPSNAQDAATKNYVDGLATGDITSTDLTVTNGTDSAFKDVTLTIANGAVTPLKIAAGANNQSLVTDNTGTVSWIDSSTFNHFGTTGSVFFAGPTGTPIEDNDQLFWDSANNRLGIGTNTPTHKLQVTGQVRATSFANADGTANSPSYRFNSDGDTGMYKEGTNELGFSTNATNAILIDASQNVGIGTVTPDESLHVANNMRLDGSFEDKDGEAGTAGQVLSSTATGTDWIDAPSADPKISTDAGNSVTAGTDAGVFYNSPIKAFGKISSAGTVIKSTPGVTVTKLAGLGHYQVTLAAGTTADSDYIIQLSQPGRGGAGNDDPGISYSSQTTTTFEVIIGDNDNGGTDRTRFDSEFMFTILDL